MVHFSYGAASHFLLLRDEVQGAFQGAVVPLPGDFRSGAHRGKFNPQDGQLYVTGMGGWGAYAVEDGCFQRVRYTGGRVQLPASFHVHENGVLATFTEPVDREIAADPRRHFAQAWNYRYQQAYGSPEFSPRRPGVVGHDQLEISAVHLVDDRTLFVELPELQPVNVLHLALGVDSGDAQQLFITVHTLDEPFTGVPSITPKPKTIAPHPQQFDMASLREPKPNPWKDPIEDARPVEIEVGKNLTYAPLTVRAAPGEAIKLRLNNPDVVPHNWVLVKPDRLAAVGDLANRLVADPEAAFNHYVPQSDDVLVHTNVVAAGESTTVYFKAPREPGRYPFLCTFPGHWMVMNGVLQVGGE
jgi:azurin